MVTVIHGPETCAVNVPENMQKYLSADKELPAAAKKLGITVQGIWLNAPGHTFFFLIDAPNAHVINQLMSELHFMDWNTVMIHPVITEQEAMARLAQRRQK
jgi:L-rhamnose mutarotase